jgi:hypothetical protein
MPRQLSSEEVSAYGLSCPSHQMDNDELRFRLMGSDGSGYIRTVAGDKGEWQNSHFHKGAIEWYGVQSGKIAFAELQPNGKVKIKIIEAGGTVQSNPGVAHNVYMFGATVTHTVKFGMTDLSLHPHCRNGDKGDWWPASDLDDATKCLTEADILERAVCP